MFSLKRRNMFSLKRMRYFLCSRPVHQVLYSTRRVHVVFKRTLVYHMDKIKVGIIGGSGLDDPKIFHNSQEKSVKTIFGAPSDVLIEGTIEGVDCVLLARHDRKHSINPTNVNYRANIWALKEAGCTHLVVTTACGSLREDYKPGDLVILDQFIDRTSKRASTFYDGTAGGPKGVCHVPMHEPFCPQTSKVLSDAAYSLGLKHHSKGTIVTIEGPRFSTRAESHVFRSWKADCINMTTVPEVVLAKEAGLCYAAVAMVTDYDCWRESQDAVNASDVLKIFKTNVGNLTNLLTKTIPMLARENWKDTFAKNKSTQENSVI